MYVWILIVILLILVGIAIGFMVYHLQKPKIKIYDDTRIEFLYSQSCRYCVQMITENNGLESIIQKANDKNITFKPIHCENGVCNKYSPEGLPCFIYYNGDSEVGRKYGYQSLSDIF